MQELQILALAAPNGDLVDAYCSVQPLASVDMLRQSRHDLGQEVVEMSFESDLNRSVVTPIVLKLVSERAMYGYEIIKLVNERTKNALQWKQGTLYPCLHRLEAVGLIRSTVRATETGRDARFYSITAKGRRLLSARLRQWSRFSAAAGALLLDHTSAAEV